MGYVLPQVYLAIFASILFGAFCAILRNRPRFKNSFRFALGAITANLVWIGYELFFMVPWMKSVTAPIRIDLLFGRIAIEVIAGGKDDAEDQHRNPEKAA